MFLDKRKDVKIDFKRRRRNKKFCFFFKFVNNRRLCDIVVYYLVY